MDQRIEYSMISKSMNQRFSGSMNHNESAEQWNNESMNQRTNINGSTIQWINEVSQWIKTNQWINESMSTSTNRWISGTVNHWINDSTVQWINESVDQRFNEPMNQRFSDLKSQWINAFFRPHLPKVLRDRHFLHFEVQIALALSAAFPQSRRKLQKHRPATMPVKTQGFLPQSAFTHEFTRSRTLFPITTWWWGWHDDARLNWWCECWPWPLSVTRKFAD